MTLAWWTSNLEVTLSINMIVMTPLILFNKPQCNRSIVSLTRLLKNCAWRIRIIQNSATLKNAVTSREPYLRAHSCIKLTVSMTQIPCWGERSRPQRAASPLPEHLHACSGYVAVARPKVLPHASSASAHRPPAHRYRYNKFYFRKYSAFSKQSNIWQNLGILEIRLAVQFLCVIFFYL